MTSSQKEYLDNRPCQNISFTELLSLLYKAKVDDCVYLGSCET